MPSVGFLYSGTPQSLQSQFNAFRSLLPSSAPLILPANPVSNDYNQLLARAHELIYTSNVTVLVAAGGTASAMAARKETAQQPLNARTPVVFTGVTDAVGNKLKEKNGNMTGVAGMTAELDGHRLRLLQEIVPSVTDIGVLIHKNRPNANDQWKNLQAAADPNLNLIRADVPGPTAIQQTILDLLSGSPPARALLVCADPLFNDQRSAIIAQGGTPLPVPAIYQWREFVEAGGLMSFGPSLVEEYAAAAAYVIRILNGEQPAAIPLYQPTNLELVINGTTARALANTIGPIPQSLLSRARTVW